MENQAQSAVNFPRVEIKFCVQCKWNLRAAYYAQELLQTFSNTIGEIGLIPVTGGIFTITLQHSTASTSSSITTTEIWDRKVDGGFPETKELKNRIRNLIDPERDMGHIDRSLRKAKGEGVGGGDKGEGRRYREPELLQVVKDEKEGGEKVKMADCEECRLVANEKLEEQIGKINSA